MVGYFVIQLDSTITLLEVFGKVGQTVQLVEDGHHISWSIVCTVDSNCVRLWQVVRARIVYHDVSAACYDDLLAGCCCHISNYIYLS